MQEDVVPKNATSVVRRRALDCEKRRRNRIKVKGNADVGLERLTVICRREVGRGKSFNQ